MKAWQPISNPLISPVQYKFLLNAGQKVDFKVAGYNKGSSKYSSYASLSGGVTGVSAPTSGVSTGPAQVCSKTLAPPTPTNFRVKSNVYNPSKKYAEVLLEWNSSASPSVGCVQRFYIQSVQANGGMKDSKEATVGGTYYTHQRNLNTGVSSKYEVWAVGFDGKISGKAVINSVVGAGATAVPVAASAGRKML
jgi:hypothetical protein